MGAMRTKLSNGEVMIDAMKLYNNICNGLLESTRDAETNKSKEEGSLI